MADTLRIEELKRRVQLDPASIAFAALAEEYRRAGMFEDAIATCEAGLLRHPAYLSARVTLGRALIEVARYDEARTELEQVLRMAPENLAAIRGLADIHHRSEVPEDSLSYPSPEPEPAPAPPDPVVPPPRSEAVAVSRAASGAGEPSLSLRPPHPDESALPGLEHFLAAVVSVRRHAH
jgi:tetratricopeptide (TPR) repeat protein